MTRSSNRTVDELGFLSAHARSVYLPASNSRLMAPKFLENGIIGIFIC